MYTLDIPNSTVHRPPLRLPGTIVRLGMIAMVEPPGKQMQKDTKGKKDNKQGSKLSA